VIYTLDGKYIDTLINKEQGTGKTFTKNVSHYGSGKYQAIFRIMENDQIVTKVSKQFTVSDPN
jgi:hypothetical protein